MAWIIVNHISVEDDKVETFASGFFVEPDNKFAMVLEIVGFRLSEMAV
jgi:hypothetical protein